MRQTDYKRIICQDDIAIWGDKLFAVCALASDVVERHMQDFGVLATDYDISHSYDDAPFSLSDPRIYELKLPSGSLDKIWPPLEKSAEWINIGLHSDGKNIWISTYDGVGRLDAEAGTLDFYKSELKLGCPSYNIRNVIVDTAHVWFLVSSNAYCSGGLVVYEKQTQKWLSFGPEHFIADQKDINFDSVSTNEEGLRVTYRNPLRPQIDMYSEYSYASGLWQRAPYRPAKEAQGLKNRDTLVIEESDFEDDIYKIQYACEFSKATCEYWGTTPIQISPVIHAKRFILTSSTVDVIDEKAKYPKTAIALNTRLSEQWYCLEANDFKEHERVQFLVDEKSLNAFVVEAGYCYPGYEGDEDEAPSSDSSIWVLDLKQNGIVKKFSIPYEKINPTLFYQHLRVTTEGEKITIIGENSESLLSFERLTGKILDF